MLFEPRGGLELPMVPSQQLDASAAAAAAAAKRKYNDQNEILGNAGKKARTDAPTIDLRPKRTEKIGGLVITRGAPSRSQSTQPPLAPSQATPALVDDGPVAGPSTIRKPPSKPPSSNGTNLSRVRRKGREMDTRGEVEGDGDVEEDVRQMNSETADLRDRTRASIANMTPGAKEIDLDLPPTNTINGKPLKSKVRQLKTQQGGKSAIVETPTKGGREGMMPVMEQETPQIAKNRLMRGEQKVPSSLGIGVSSNGQQGGLTRRRSSFSSRGKRSSSSYESTGIITRPHTSVKDTSLYKHIDPDLPDSQRLRQLLVWVTSRVSDALTAPSKGKTKRQEPDPSLPELPPGGEELLQEIQNDIIRQVADGKVDTNVYSDPSSPKKALKENEQNVKNRAREKLFTEQIEERRKEDVAWAEVAQFYNAYQSSILSTISQEKKASARAKGKQRATSQEPEDPEPWENELPEEFRGANGYDAAKHLLEVGLNGARDKDPRLEDLEYREDRLHAALTVADELTKVVTLDLDQRFSLLSSSLAQRTLPPPPGVPPGPSGPPHTLSNFAPPTSSTSSTASILRRIATDPRDLLRALTRADAAKPLGDAARRAAKDVARVRESQAQLLPASGSGDSMVNVAERRLVGVPPATPRKPPGTPKRAMTPGTGRR